MRDGKIVQMDRPETLYRDPANAWIAEFLRSGSLITGMQTDSGFVPYPNAPAISVPSANGHRGEARLLIPDSAVRIAEGGNGDAEVVVGLTRFKGERYEVIAHWPDDPAGEGIHFWHDTPIRPQTRVPLCFLGEKLRLFPRSGRPHLPQSPVVSVAAGEPGHATHPGRPQSQDDSDKRSHS